MKKTLSLVLSLVMIISTLCALPFTAKAGTPIDKAEIEYTLKAGSKKYFNIADGNYTVEDYTWKYRDGTGALKNTYSTENAYINYNYVLYVELKAKSGYNFDTNFKLTFNGGAVPDNSTFNSNRADAYEELDYYGNQCFTTSSDGSTIWFSVRFYPVGVSFYGNAPSGRRPDISTPEFVSPGQQFFVERGQIYADTHITQWRVSKTKLSNGAQDIIPYDSEAPNGTGIYITAPVDAVKVAAMVYVDECQYLETVVTPATCTEKGQSARICPVCKAKEYGSEKEIPAAGHTYGTAGDARFTCSVCGTVDAAKKAEVAIADAQSAIAALPEASKVTAADKDKIEAARKAFDALTAEQKAKFTAVDYMKLTDAEAALAAATTTVAKNPYTLTFSKISKIKKSAKKTTIKLTLKKNGKIQKNKKVTLTVAGKTYTAKTNKKGVATFTIKKAAVKKLKVNKKTKLVAKYGKNITKTKQVKVVK